MHSTHVSHISETCWSYRQGCSGEEERLRENASPGRRTFCQGNFIQFTLEREKDRHLPFLVTRRGQGNLETSVYRKPTHTDKHLAFDSHQPIFYKMSAAKTLLRRADCPPSSLDSKAEERKDVSNGYTKAFLRNCQKPVTTISMLRNPSR